MAMYKFSFTNGRDHGERTSSSITFSLPTVCVTGKGEDPVAMASEMAAGIRHNNVPEDFYSDLLRIKVLVHELCQEFRPQTPIDVKPPNTTERDD